MYCISPFRISFAETDAMAIVHHSNHNRFFERGRIEFLRLAGIVYADMAAEGIHFPVLRTECKYKRAIHFDNRILVESRISKLTKTRLEFSYRIFRVNKDFTNSMLAKPFDETEDLVTEGISEHCCLAPDGKPQRIPANTLTLLNNFFDGRIN